MTRQKRADRPDSTAGVAGPSEPSEAAPDRTATRERLIEAAEHAIAAAGVEAASMRAINARAGVNVAAAHYHFGSKLTLVEAVLAHRMTALAARRDRHLAALDSAAGTPPLHAVVEAFVRPLEEVRSQESWGPTYLRFLAALARATEPWRGLLARQAALHRAAFDAELGRALADLPVPLRRVRFGWVALTVVTALADSPEETTAETADALIAYAVGALGAPTGPRVEL
ncbi:TetR/AcrR family transcriptional regulator [Embleya sp. NPDC001921]